MSVPSQTTFLGSVLIVVTLHIFLLVKPFFRSLIVFSTANILLTLLQRGDVRKSEECYERAILADPYDGEVLSQYAKLQWAAHKDERRAEMYYDQAIQAAPNDWLVGLTITNMIICLIYILTLMPCMVV